MRLYGVVVKTGTEGPSHDPYGFKSVKFRQATYFDGALSGERCTFNTPDGLARFEGEDARRTFKQVYGVTPDRLVRIVERQKNRELFRHYRTCPKAYAARDCSGYPGESFTVCGCGMVLDYSFDESDVV